MDLTRERGHVKVRVRVSVRGRVSVGVRVWVSLGSGLGLGSGLVSGSRLGLGSCMWVHEGGTCGSYEVTLQTVANHSTSGDESSHEPQGLTADR